MDTADADDMSSPDCWVTGPEGGLVGVVFNGLIPTCVNGIFVASTNEAF